MKNILFSLFLFGCIGAVNVEASPQFLLPEDHAIYTDGKTVVNWQPSDRYEKKSLPTFNFYEGEHGGYIAVYTRESSAGIYSVGKGIYVIGQVRVEGRYVGRSFVPKGYKRGDNITKDPELLEICAQYFPDMVGKMWVGGDTGGWFGIQN